MTYFSSSRFWFLTIFIALLFAYSNSFQTPFIFDDLKSIPENPFLRDLSQSLFQSPQEGETVSSRPLVHFSFALNYAWSGLDVWSYHLLNFFIHFGASLFLFGFLRRTFALYCFFPSTPSDATLLAGSTCLLWAIHPLQTESVTYLVQRSESLMGFFYLATLWAFTRSLASSFSTRWLVLSVLFCFSGMLTKEIMVTAPWVVLLYDRIFIEPTLKSLWSKRRWYYISLFSSWIVFALLFLQSERRGNAIGFGGEISVFEYLQTQAYALCLYLKLFFWPHPLILDYGVVTVTDLRIVLPCALLIFLIGFGILWLIRYHPRFGFWGIWMALILGPTSSFIPIHTQTIVEHRTYLALIPLIFYGVMISYRFFGRKIVYGALLLATIWGIRTFVRNKDYQSVESIWKSTVTHAPDNERARNNYAGALFQINQWNEAETQMLHVLKMTKSPTPIQFKNLGAVYQNQGRLEEAEIQYRRALDLEKKYPEGWFHFVSLLVQQNRLHEGLKANQEAVQWNPHDGILQSNLASIYLMLQRVSEAKIVLRKQIELKNPEPTIYLNYGGIYESHQQWEEAEAIYLKALENQVTHPEILERLQKIQSLLLDK